MRLIGRMDKLKQARVEGFIRYPPDNVNLQITFLVDTGCSNSCILPDDVKRLSIDHGNLQTVTKTIVTANGPVNLKVIQNAEVVLPVQVGLLDNKRAYVTFPMENLAVLPPGSNYVPLPKELIFSLLGMDVLSHFPRWNFGKERLVMENDEVLGLKMSFKL
jgi:predicted aspartyl protease